MLSFTKNIGSCKKEELTIVKSNLSCLTYNVSREVFYVGKFHCLDIQTVKFSNVNVIRNIRDKLKNHFTKCKKEISGTSNLAVVNSNQINDKSIVLGNLLFDTIISNDVYQ